MAILVPDPIVPVYTTRIIRDFGVPTHRLDDARVIIGLADQMRTEYGATWYAVITFANGRAICTGASDSAPAPEPEVLDKMLSIALILNRNLDLRGCWIVVWHMQRISALWRDEDGDAAFIQQFDEPWVRIRNWSAHEFCARAASAWTQWAEMIRHTFERHPTETIKQAQGQRSASTRQN